MLFVAPKPPDLPATFPFLARLTQQTYKEWKGADEQGRSEKALAEEMGISQSQLNAVRNQTPGKVGLETVWKLAHFYRAPIDLLLGRKIPPRTAELRWLEIEALAVEAAKRGVEEMRASQAGATPIGEASKWSPSEIPTAEEEEREIRALVGDRFKPRPKKRETPPVAKGRRQAR